MLSGPSTSELGAEPPAPRGALCRDTVRQATDLTAGEVNTTKNVKAGGRGQGRVTQGPRAGLALRGGDEDDRGQGAGCLPLQAGVRQQQQHKGPEAGTQRGRLLSRRRSDAGCLGTAGRAPEGVVGSGVQRGLSPPAAGPQGHGRRQQARVCGAPRERR